MKKERLDVVMMKKSLAETRTKAQALIMSGEVNVNGIVVDKCGTLVAEDAVITVTEKMPFVSRGGIKLNHAIEYFHISLDGKIALDIGASTGGFTDCLLKQGVQKVYAVDVGTGQLDSSLRKNPRVVVHEKCNARYLSKELIPDTIDIITIDVSFISLTKILPAIKKLAFDGFIIALIKPQFEAGQRYVKKGVVKDPAVHTMVIQTVTDTAIELGFIPCGVTPSPIKGPKGNIEFLLLLASSIKHADGVHHE